MILFFAFLTIKLDSCYEINSSYKVEESFAEVLSILFHDWDRSIKFVNKHVAMLIEQSSDYFLVNNKGSA